MTDYLKYQWQFPAADVDMHTNTEAPPLLALAEDTVWWMGEGVYRRQTDGLWVSEDARIASIWTTTDYFSTLGSAFAVASVVVDVHGHILRSLAALNLPPEPYYAYITRETCERLAEIADRWHFSYAWSEQERHRFLKRPLKWLSFYWSIGEKLCV